MIYFDHNATTPYSPSVRAYLQTDFLEDWQNPSSVYPQAMVLDQKIRECKRFIADHLNCSPKHLFFTSGGTESINTVLSLETLKQNRLSGFITSFLEHKATLKKIDRLSQYSNTFPEPLTQKQSTQTGQITANVWPSNDIQSQGVNQKFNNKGRIKTGKTGGNKIGFCYVPHNKQGEIKLNDLEEVCSKNPQSLLSFLSANNETGVVTDIKAVSKIAKKYDCLVHVDAVQSLGKEPLDLEDGDVDFASFSGHKIGAMKGVGLLYAKKPFTPLMFGGNQERGLRPGTYNFPAVYSFKLAVQDIDLTKQEYVRQLRDYFERRLSSLFAGHEFSKDTGLPSKKSETRTKTESLFFKINCAKADRLSNTSNIYCGGGASNQSILLYLARKGICVSTGSACNAGSPEPSHVITQLALFNDGGSSQDYANSCLRVSFAPSNTKEEVDFLIHSLKEFYSIDHPYNLSQPEYPRKNPVNFPTKSL